MAGERLEYVRVGMRRNGTNIRLKLRWENSPDTCEVVSKALPVESQLWHAKYASNEIYILLPVVETFGRDPKGEWQCMYPAPGDLMWLFHPPGLIPGDLSPPHAPRRIVDVAYFYDRGNSLYGPWGPNPGNIFATATSFEDLDRMARACREVWFNGIANERMYIEAA